MKTGVENYIFWCEIGSCFEEPGGTVPPRIPRSTPPPKAKPPISFFFMFAHTQRIARNSLKSSSNLWRCGALNNIEFNYGKPESKENFFLPLTLIQCTQCPDYNNNLHISHSKELLFTKWSWTIDYV